MQVTPPLQPTITALAQDVTAKALPHIQAQAAVPLTRRPVEAGTKAQRNPETRSNKDRAKGGGLSGKDATGNEAGDPASGSVNIRV